MNAEELKHHGIKGQKWGRRRFQNEDGTLTPAGKERYDDDGDSNTNNSHKNKSMRRMNLEDKYQKQGMSKAEAEKAADKRIKTEIFVVAAAATMVIGGALYKKHLDNGRDFTISKDVDLQRIIRLDKGADPYKSNREYVSYKKLDNMKYTGMMGKFEGDTAKAMNKGLDKIVERNPGIKLTQNYQEMYKMKIVPKQDIKVASVNRAKDTFSSLYKNDPEFKNMYNKWMIDISTNNPKAAHGSFKKFAKAVSKGEVDDAFLKSTGYKAFNVSIAERDDVATAIQNKFYNALKSQGMNAIVDLNDKQGMLKSSAPLITFDGAFDYSKTVLSDQEIRKSLAMSVPVLLAQNAAKPAAIALTVLYGKNTISNTKNNNELIRNYKKEHPNTKLTDKDILDMLKNK